MLSSRDWHTRFTQQAQWTASLRDYLFAKLELNSSQRIIEVGCGTGALLTEIQSRLSQHTHLHGLDINENHLTLAKALVHNVHLVLGDAHQLPYAKGSFDIGLCHFLLIWVLDPERVIAEMKRLVRPGGWVLALAEPDYGGRIDHPAELAQLGAWQEQALKHQGADTRLGRRLGAMLYNAGLDQVEYGVLGGQWQGHSPDHNWQIEWDVLMTDLSDTIDSQQLLRLKSIDERASLQGQRVLYVPTFYALGKVTRDTV